MPLTPLIVDDSAITRALIARTFRLCGLDVEKTFEASDGREALGIARREKVNLILTDLNMPEMGGAALAQEILSDPATRHIPVVVVSADPNPSRAKDLADLGVRGFIRKPFTPEALRDTLGQLLGDAQ